MKTPKGKIKKKTKPLIQSVNQLLYHALNVHFSQSTQIYKHATLGSPI